MLAHAELAKLVRTPICLDESIISAQAAEDAFVRTFSKRELPDDIREAKVNLQSFTTDSITVIGANPSQALIDLVKTVKVRPLLVSLGLVPSATEAGRLIESGAVEVNGEKVASPTWKISHGDVIRVGKHKFVRIVDADLA